ncbi:MAG: ABC transporter substrate-binding protein, partial [Pseudomonadales bacterium]|nr:ABC transporter substrate-binding protein [Pseudomonadales bacterium]
MTRRAPLRPASALAVLLLLVACGGDEAPTQAEADAEAAARAATEAAKAEHYATDPSIPPAVYEALEGGRITQAELDARIEAGEFEPFYVFATPEDLPTDLAWQDGMDLPDLGSPEAVKGGTYRSTIPDFPRTLRRAGPDSNSSFRPWIQDHTVMGMAQRHPNVTDIVDSEFRYFPGIAEAWAIDRESATVYVRIDPAARFSDGEPITTDDVLFTFFLLQNPHVNAPFAQNFINRNFTRITVYDEHTWSATLPESKPYMASRALSLEPWPEHVFPVVDETFLDRYQWTYVPSSGPYTIREEDVRKGRSVTLTRVDDWWAKDRKFWRNRYNFDRITLTVVRDAAKRFEAFRKGEVDATS